MISLFDVVRLRTKGSPARMREGAVGTVVHVFEQPSLAYVVEVADEEGRTKRLLTVAPDEIEVAAWRARDTLGEQWMT